MSSIPSSSPSSPPSKKRDADDSKSLSLSDEPVSKKQKTEDASFVIEEIEEWLMPPVFATLLVKISICNPDVYEDKRKTHVLNLHCSPAALAMHSKYFQTLIEGDPKVSEIEMPESFTYQCVQNVIEGGELAVEPEQVILLFKYFHCQIEFDYMVGLDTKYEILLMLFYLDSPILFKKVERKCNITHNNCLPHILWACYFKSEHLLEQIYTCLQNAPFSLQNHEHTMAYIKLCPRDVLDTLVCKLITSNK